MAVDFNLASSIERPFGGSFALITLDLALAFGLGLGFAAGRLIGDEAGP